MSTISRKDQLLSYIQTIPHPVTFEERGGDHVDQFGRAKAHPNNTISLNGAFTHLEYGSQAPFGPPHPAALEEVNHGLPHPNTSYPIASRDPRIRNLMDVPLITHTQARHRAYVNSY